MPAHSWMNRVYPLNSPAFLKRKQHDDIRLAVTETQDECVTDIRNTDGTLDITKTGGEVRINFKDSEDGGSDGVTGVFVFSGIPVWNDPVLRAPTYEMAIVKGRVMSVKYTGDTTIDTAEACA